jgi:hypothetical protein
VQQAASSLQKPTRTLFIFPPGISSCWCYVKTTMQRKAMAAHGYCTNPTVFNQMAGYSSATGMKHAWIRYWHGARLYNCCPTSPFS